MTDRSHEHDAGHGHPNHAASPGVLDVRSVAGTAGGQGYSLSDASLGPTETRGARGGHTPAHGLGRTPQQVQHFVSTGLQFGYLYESPLIAADAAPKPSEDVVDYLPTTYPGARLPHSELLVDGIPIAAHDAIDATRLSLFTFDGDAWNAALGDLSMPAPGVVVVGAEPGSATVIVQFEVSVRGAVLVRPDGHVAWPTSSPAHEGSVALVEFLRSGWSSYFPVCAVPVARRTSGARRVTSGG